MTTRRSIALILSPVGLLLISAGRLIIISNFNTTTAVTVASSGGFVNTLLGTVIPLVPVFIPYLALLLLLFRRFLLTLMTFMFAAFISPTSITSAEVFNLARADWNALNQKIAYHHALVIVAVIVVLVALWAHNRSFAEGLSIIVAGAVACALVIAVPSAIRSVPLRLASSNEHRLAAKFAAKVAAKAAVYGIPERDILLSTVLLALAIIVLVNLGNIKRIHSHFSWLLMAVVSLVAAIALFPYVHYIYPVPQTRDYYAEATHAMWLPAERIATSTGRIYYAYVLSSDGIWLTVLLTNSRTIAYIPVTKVVSRSVCQPTMTAQPKEYPPLIPWLYNSPAHLPTCGR
jgi:hypothetical protein